MLSCRRRLVRPFTDGLLRCVVIRLQLVQRTEADDLNLDYDPIAVYSDKQGGGVMKASDAYRESLYTQEWVTSKVTQRVDNLCAVGIEWFKAIVRSVNALPRGVRWICKQIFEEVRKKKRQPTLHPSTSSPGVHA